MADKPKRPRDANQLAKMVVDIATGEVGDTDPVEKAVGQRAGGLKGGAARARKLSSSERKAIAQKAAKIRWKKDRLARETKEPT